MKTGAIIDGPTASALHVMDMQQPQLTEARKQREQPLSYRRREFLILTREDSVEVLSIPFILMPIQTLVQAPLSPNLSL